MLHSPILIWEACGNLILGIPYDILLLMIGSGNLSLSVHILLIFSLNFSYSRQAWQKLGAMPPEDAMQKYIDTVSELYPTWLDGSALVS